MEDQINFAIAYVSAIRTELRYLEKIRDDARSLARQSKDEETLSHETNRELQKLQDLAKKHHSMVEETYQQVFKTWENVRDLENSFDFDVPTGRKAHLRKRHHILHNEFQECPHLANTVRSVRVEITEFCRQVPIVVEPST